MTEDDKNEKPTVRAENNSIAVGGIDVGGNVGDIHIGHTIGYSAEQVSTLIAQISTTFQPKPFDGRCPYKGLDVFEETDADLFFGREKLVENLVSRVKESRTVFITGPSGSGKSSLVRAGLIHALKQGAINKAHSESWQYATIKPGRDPFEALKNAFARLKSPELGNYFIQNIAKADVLNECAESSLSENSNQRLVLFIDQFEEVFTQLNRETERVTFFNLLTHTTTVENGRVIILFSMRSDFVSNCATYPKLNEILNQQFVQIGAMGGDELVSAIAQPALRVGLRIDPDLIAQIINDMEGEPGSLPLMQFALKDLFDAEQERGGIIALTLKDYLERGGIRKSLERHADKIFAGFNTVEQELARSIFSGLIEVGHGTQDTRRTAIFDELVPARIKSGEIEAIVRKLADARLITTDEVAGKDTVTISHEKLIDAWPWLRRLVNENRDVIALQNEIAEDAKEWDEHKRDASYLYSGGRLLNTQEKLKANKLSLSGKALEFVNTGIKRRTVTRTAVIAGVILVIASLITATLVFQRQKAIATFNAIEAQKYAATAQENAALAQAQARNTLARQLAAQATLIQGDKRDLALLLSAEAYDLNANLETQGSMLSTLQCCSDALIAFLPGHEDSIWDVAFSPDGKILASGGNDGSVILWDLVTRKEIKRLFLRESTATIYTLAFSPNGKILAIGDGTGAIKFIDTQTWEEQALILHGHNSSLLSMKYSNDGKFLVSGGTDGNVILWDAVHYAPLKFFKGSKSWVWDVAISPDNNTVVAVGNDRILHIWDLRPDALNPSVEIQTSRLVSAEFNSDVQFPLLLTGDTGGKVIIWDFSPWQKNRDNPIPTSSLATGPGATSVVWGVAFMPKDNLTFITGRDNGILNRNKIIIDEKDFLNTSLSHESLGLTGNNLGVFRISISPDGKIIAAGGQDGLVSLWSTAETTNVIRHSSELSSMQISNTDTNTVTSLDNKGSLLQWDYLKQTVITKINLSTEPILESTINADGTLIATGYEDGSITIWDGKKGIKLSTYKNHTAKITNLTFSQNGKYMASSDVNGNIILWNILKNGKLEPFPPVNDSGNSAIQVLLFDKDGATLVGGGCNTPILFPAPDCSKGAIYIWDIQPQLHLRGKPLPGKAGFVWSMAINPANSDELATGTRDGTVTIWNLKNQTARISFRIGKSDITALAFSPDGTLLAVGADIYKVYVYNAMNGQVYGQAFREHDGSVTTLAFTADGNSLLSASLDSTIVVHNMNPFDWFQNVCRIANRNLTRAEWEQYIGNALPYQAVCDGLPIEQ